MFGSLLAPIAGAVIGGLGSKGSSVQSATVKTGFEQLPEFAQDLYKEQYAPAVQEAFTGPFVSPFPLEQVGAPQSVFDSPELYKLQQYSDMVGGLFGQPQGLGQSQATQNTADVQATQAQQQAMQQQAIMGQQLAGALTSTNMPGIMGYNSVDAYRPKTFEDYVALGRYQELPAAQKARVATGQFDKDLAKDIFGGLNTDNLSAGGGMLELFLGA